MLFYYLPFRHYLWTKSDMSIIQCVAKLRKSSGQVEFLLETAVFVPYLHSMAATATAKKQQDKQAAKILNGGSAHQRNTLDSLLNRAIKFRKSRYVDEKLELFKKKYAPINDRTTIQSSSALSNSNDVLPGIDANGFEQPSKILFSKEKLNPAWTTIRPIGAGLSSDLGPTSALNTVLQVVTYTPILCNYLLSRWHGNNCMFVQWTFYGQRTLISLTRYNAWLLLCLCTGGSCLLGTQEYKGHHYTSSIHWQTQE